MGSIVDNEIFANRMAAVAISYGGASTVRGNIIRDSVGGTVICQSSRANVIHAAA